jgi:ATP-dependent Clp protease protease subunit
MGVFDAIQLCRAPVSTIAFGFAASTAAILLAAGTKGKRFAMPNSRIMLHQPMGGASGQVMDVEIQAKEIMYHKTNITRILSEITGRSVKQIEEDIDRDRFLSPLEAVEYGIIDGVIDKDAILPLSPAPEKVKRRSDYQDAEQDPLKFLIPVIPDDEIY